MNMADNTQDLNGGVPGGNYGAEQAPNGTWTIKSLPIFSEVKSGARGNDQHIGSEWMNAAIAKCKELSLVQQHMAPVHLGHHGALKNKDTPRVGFLKLSHIGKMPIEGVPSWTLFADIVGISEKDFAELKDLSHPYRSVEIGDWNKPEIASLALLSDESPYFKFPMMTIGEAKETTKASMKFEGSEGDHHFFEFAEKVKFAGIPQNNRRMTVRISAKDSKHEDHQEQGNYLENTTGRRRKITVFRDPTSKQLVGHQKQARRGHRHHARIEENKANAAAESRSGSAYTRRPIRTKRTTRGARKAASHSGPVLQGIHATNNKTGKNHHFVVHRAANGSGKHTYVGLTNKGYTVHSTHDIPAESDNSLEAQGQRKNHVYGNPSKRKGTQTSEFHEFSRLMADYGLAGSNRKQTDSFKLEDAGRRKWVKGQIKKNKISDKKPGGSLQQFSAPIWLRSFSDIPHWFAEFTDWENIDRIAKRVGFPRKSTRGRPRDIAEAITKADDLRRKKAGLGPDATNRDLKAAEDKEDRSSWRHIDQLKKRTPKSAHKYINPKWKITDKSGVRSKPRAGIDYTIPGPRGTGLSSFAEFADKSGFDTGSYRSHDPNPFYHGNGKNKGTRDWKLSEFAHRKVGNIFLPESYPERSSGDHQTRHGDPKGPSGLPTAVGDWGVDQLEKDKKTPTSGVTPKMRRAAKRIKSLKKLDKKTKKITKGRMDSSATSQRLRRRAVRRARAAGVQMMNFHEFFDWNLYKGNAQQKRIMSRRAGLSSDTLGGKVTPESLRRKRGQFSEGRKDGNAKWKIQPPGIGWYKEFYE